MNTLIGSHISLRAIEPSDLEFLYKIENNESFWSVSNTQKPFSKYVLRQYLENAHQDIYEAKQLRLLIFENDTKNAVGMIDLFDFEPKHRRIGIGILIIPAFENKNYATEAVQLLIKYCFKNLDIHQLYANITADNYKSIALFEKQGFQKIGTKKDWIFTDGKFNDEILYQLLHE